MHCPGELSVDCISFRSGSERQPFALGHLHAYARNLALSQSGKKAAPMNRVPPTTKAFIFVPPANTRICDIFSVPLPKGR